MASTVQPLGPREYSLTVQGRASTIRITTDPGYFERHADSVELWSPGGGAFPADWPPVSEHQQWATDMTLGRILEVTE